MEILLDISILYYLEKIYYTERPLIFLMIWKKTTKRCPPPFHPMATDLERKSCRDMHFSTNPHIDRGGNVLCHLCPTLCLSTIVHYLSCFVNTTGNSSLCSSRDKRYDIVVNFCAYNINIIRKLMMSMIYVPEIVSIAPLFTSLRDKAGNCSHKIITLC